MNERVQPMPGRARPVAALATALLVPAAILAVAGPGRSPQAAAWPTAGLVVLAIAWLASLLALCPRQAEPGSPRLSRSWRGAYYAGLLALLAGLIAKPLGGNNSRYLTPPNSTAAKSPARQRDGQAGRNGQ